MYLKNKKVLVYGLGQSGRAVAKVLKDNFAYVSLYDDDIRFFDQVGFDRDPYGKDYDFVVVSPGVVCRGNKLLEHFRKRNILILSELDFGYLLCRGKIVAITGTNGKTTTCTLVRDILKQAGYETFLCGNIGLPLSAIASKTTKKSVIVCEVSSFQLELSQFFHANVACILNVKPDHIDRHGSFEGYKQTKAKIAANMKRKDVLVLNLDDEEAKCMILHKKFQYFTKYYVKRGVCITNGNVCIDRKPIFSEKAIKLRGDKNLENVLAAVSVCSHFKVKADDYVQAIEKFRPASHRMEVVGTIDGVTFVDDSKATNVASTLACLDAFKKENVILLLGGSGKDIAYDEIFKQKPNIKVVICFGAERENIAKSARAAKVKTFVCEKFDSAVLKASRLTIDGDFVLLSPACASFDEFENYKQRGDRFKEIVLGLLDEK